MESLGYRVQFVRDGAEAFEAYRTAKESGHSFDVVIMDLTIPGGMGGKEALKKLKGIDRRLKLLYRAAILMTRSCLIIKNTVLWG